MELFSRENAETFHVAFGQKWDLPSKVAPIVEPSMYQKIPRGVERPDEVEGKLEDYEPFKKFLEAMAAEKVSLLWVES